MGFGTSRVRYRVSKGVTRFGFGDISSIRRFSLAFQVDPGDFQRVLEALLRCCLGCQMRYRGLKGFQGD